MTDLHSVPTPLDARPVNLRDDVANDHAADVAAVPVRDLPMRRDEPSEPTQRPLSERPPFDILVFLAGRPADEPVKVRQVVDFRWRGEGKLDVVAVVDGRVQRIETFGPYVAERVSVVREVAA